MNQVQSIFRYKTIKKYMKNSIKYILLCFLFISANTWGQQEGKLIMFHKNMNIINPAYTGANNTTTFILTIQSQWQGVENAPKLQAFSFGMPVGKNLGIGTSFTNDKVFIEKQTTLDIDFSYRIPFSYEVSLYLGLKAGGSFYNIDVSTLQSVNTIDNLDISDQNKFSPNIGVGAYLSHEKFYLSLAAPRILGSERLEDKSGINVIAQQRMHLYFSGGYKVYLNDKFTLKPEFMTRYVSGAPFSADIIAAVKYDNSIELAGIISTDSAVGGYISLAFGDVFSFGYSYTNSTKSQLSQFTEGSHEILLKIRLGNNKRFQAFR